MIEFFKWLWADHKRVNSLGKAMDYTIVVALIMVVAIIVVHL